MNTTHLIALGRVASAQFAARHHLSDRRPQLSETFHYAEAGMTVCIAVAGNHRQASEDLLWDIEVHLADGESIAIWHSAIETNASYPDALAALWPLVLAALTAAGRGDLILEVAGQHLPLAS